MLKRTWFLALVVAHLACGVRPTPQPPTPPPTPAPTYTFGVVACAAAVPLLQPCPTPIANATIRVNTTAGYEAKLANADGYAVFTSSIPFSDVWVSADSYIDTKLGIQPPTIDGRNISITLTSAHFDPTGVPLGALAAIRGGMWPLGPVRGLPQGLTLGPRPGAPDNVIATAFFADYTPNEQYAIIAELKARGYTHVVMGPLVDSDGYHGMYAANDWRGARWSEFLDIAQRFWDAGLAPVVFISPDGWTLEQNQAEFTALLQQPRAQQLLRIVVPHGWEPERYGTSSCTWALWGQWARQVLPNALVAMHTVSDTDAPVGTDTRCNDDDKTWNPGGNAAGWGRVTPYFHVWLTQSGAFADPTGTGGDRDNPTFTNFQNWQRQFDLSVRGSYRDRFERGYAGWPTGSAWGPDKPLRVVCGEYKAYWTFWQHRSEAEGVQWGDACIAAGGYGYLDSGSVAVPIK